MYYEIAKVSISNRNIIIEEDKLNNYIADSIKNKTELYHSVYKYDETIIEHFKKASTIRNFRGTIQLPFLIFDIDRAKNTDELVLLRVREFINKLIDDWQLFHDNISVWYSGTGYHVYIHNYFGDTFCDRTVIKNTMSRYFSESDPAIYGATGLIRAPYSLNLKSGLYKIPLTSEEIFKLNHIQIMELAKSNDIRQIPKIEKDDTKDWSEYIELSAPIKGNATISVDPVSNSVNRINCVQKMYNQGQPRTNRHVEALRIAGVFRRIGVPKQAIESLMREYNKTLAWSEIQRIIDDTFKSGYAYGCNDSVLMQYCDDKCEFYKRKNLVVTTTNAFEMEDELRDHIKKRLNANNIINLRYMLGLRSDYKIYPGEFVVFMGDTKLGKSMVVQNLMVSYPNIKFLLLSLENGRILDSRRLMQIANDMTKEEVNEALLNGEDSLSEGIKHIKFMDDRLHINDLPKLVTSSECDVIVIDTADQIRTKTDPQNYTGKTEELALAIREIANATEKTLIIVHHISKGSSQDEKGKSKQLTVHSGKGASAIEQKADKVIGIEGDRDGILRTITSLAARDEEPFAVEMRFNKNTFRLEKLR